MAANGEHKQDSGSVLDEEVLDGGRMLQLG